MTCPESPRPASCPSPLTRTDPRPCRSRGAGVEAGGSLNRVMTKRSVRYGGHGGGRCLHDESASARAKGHGRASYTASPSESQAARQAPSPIRERVGVRDQVYRDSPRPSPCPSPGRERGPALDPGFLVIRGIPFPVDPFGSRSARFPGRVERRRSPIQDPARRPSEGSITPAPFVSNRRCGPTLRLRPGSPAARAPGVRDIGAPPNHSSGNRLTRPADAPKTRRSPRRSAPRRPRACARRRRGRCAARRDRPACPWPSRSGCGRETP